MAGPEDICYNPRQPSAKQISKPHERSLEAYIRFAFAATRQERHPTRPFKIFLEDQCINDDGQGTELERMRAALSQLYGAEDVMDPTKESSVSAKHASFKMAGLQGRPNRRERGVWWELSEGQRGITLRCV